MKLRDVAAFLVGAGVATVAVGLALRWLTWWAHQANGTTMPEALMVRRVVSRGRRAVRQKMGRR